MPPQPRSAPSTPVDVEEWISPLAPSDESARQGRVSHILLRSHLKTLSDRRDIRDVTGADDGSGERDESVDQFLELLVV